MNKKLVTTGLLSGLLATGAASAATIEIGDITGEWIAATPAGAIDGVNTNQIFWGTPADTERSSYLFEGKGNVAEEEWDPLLEDYRFDLGTFTHFNFPITAPPPALETAQLQVDTQLFVNDTERNITSVFTFDHVETPNDDNPCFDGNPNGVEPNQNGCADRVTFSFNEETSDSFLVAGERFEIGISGFQEDDESPAEVFWTSEALTNVATLRGVVRQQMPVPATLPLYGLGLAGLGLAAARRWRR